MGAGHGVGLPRLTQGYLEGEVVRRITGQTIGEFAAKEVTGPLGADFHIGTAAEHDSRVAHVIPPSAPLSVEGAEEGSVALRTLRNPDPPLDAAESSTIPWRRAEIPAAGGHANARAVALVHTPMACGGEANGVRLLVAAGHRAGVRRADYGPGPGARRWSSATASGSGCRRPEVPISPNERACFWGGWGGSVAIIDLDTRMSFSYVMTKMGEGTVGDLRAAGLLLAAYMALAGQADAIRGLRHPSVPCRTGAGTSGALKLGWSGVAGDELLDPHRFLGEACCGRRGGGRPSRAAARSPRPGRSRRRSGRRTGSAGAAR